MGDRDGGTDRTGMVQQELTPEEVEQRGAKLASLELERIELQAKKATHNRKWNEELIQLKSEIAQYAEEVDSRKAWVPAQTAMPFDGGDPENDAEEEAPAGNRRRARGRRGAAAASANA